MVRVELGKAVARRPDVTGGRRQERQVGAQRCVDRLGVVAVRSVSRCHFIPSNRYGRTRRGVDQRVVSSTVTAAAATIAVDGGV